MFPSSLVLCSCLSPVVVVVRELHEDVQTSSPVHVQHDQHVFHKVPIENPLTRDFTNIVRIVLNVRDPVESSAYAFGPLLTRPPRHWRVPRPTLVSFIGAKPARLSAAPHALLVGIGFSPFSRHHCSYDPRSADDIS